MNNNKIEEWTAIGNLEHNKKLQTVYLEHNRITSESNYRRKMKLLVPWLVQLDATLCR